MQSQPFIMNSEQVYLYRERGTRGPAPREFKCRRRVTHTPAVGSSRAVTAVGSTSSSRLPLVSSATPGGVLQVQGQENK
jgi:hypothetical protein